MHFEAQLSIVWQELQKCSAFTWKYASDNDAINRRQVYDDGKRLRTVSVKDAMLSVSRW
jgi:hypothetical protein